MILVIIAVLFLPSGCGGGEKDGPERLDIWIHSAQPDERETLLAQVDRFNESQKEIEARATVIPEGSYNGQVQASAVAGDLPDLLEFDGPYMYNYAWQGMLLAIGDRLPGSVTRALLPTLIEQGTYNDTFYSVGNYDSGLGLYADRGKLEKAGVRVPEGPAGAWTIAEFNSALAALAEQDADGKVLDLKLNYGNEYFTYAYSPVLVSAGGDLIDRSDYQSADGVLNGPESVQAMKQVQGWFEKGYVDQNLDDAAFTGGRVALSWVGHWEYGRYSKALGEELVILPLPDFGNGTRTGQGSWNWGITRFAEKPENAVRFLEFILQPGEVLAMVEANGAVPGTRTAIEQSRRYKEDGPLRLFAVQLMEGYSVPRPRTPAYPIISSAFAEAFHDIRNGGDVQTVLDEAVRIIDQDIQTNNGYPPQERKKEQADHHHL